MKSNTVTMANVDVESVVSWKKGLFIFKEKPLKEIMRVLSRWYDVDVVFENEDLKEIKFRGVIGKYQKIEGILSIMKSTTITNYEIKDKTIILR